MPGRDRTGPMGQGAMSGRKSGGCTDWFAMKFNTPRQWCAFAMNGRSDGSGRAFGRLRSGNPCPGKGRPFRMRMARRCLPDDAPVDKEALKQYRQALQSEMAAVNKHLDELDKGAQDDRL